MVLTFEQKKKASEQFKKKAENMDNITILHAADKGRSKFERMDAAPPNALVKFWHEIKMLISLLKDYISGRYKKIPFTSIATVAAAIAYFVSPIDVIPDFIPGIGYLDDAAVIGFVLSILHDELREYKDWKRNL